MNDKYLEDDYKELEHKDIPKTPHPSLEYKNKFENGGFSFNSYGVDERVAPFHTLDHQKMDVEVHIENHILQTLEAIRKDIKGSQNMSNTQDNAIVMDRLDVLEKNVKDHVTEAKIEINNNTDQEVALAESNIKTAITNSTNSIESTVKSQSDSLFSRITNWFNGRL